MLLPLDASVMLPPACGNFVVPNDPGPPIGHGYDRDLHRSAFFGNYSVSGDDWGHDHG
jgi:hypothetical protein